MNIIGYNPDGSPIYGLAAPTPPLPIHQPLFPMPVMPVALPTTGAGEGGTIFEPVGPVVDPISSPLPINPTADPTDPLAVDPGLIDGAPVVRPLDTSESDDETDAALEDQQTGPIAQTSVPPATTSPVIVYSRAPGWGNAPARTNWALLALVAAGVFLIARSDK